METIPEVLFIYLFFIKSQRKPPKCPPSRHNYWKPGSARKKQSNVEVQRQQENKKNSEGSLMRTTCTTTGSFRGTLLQTAAEASFQRRVNTLKHESRRKTRDGRTFPESLCGGCDHATLWESQRHNCAAVQTESQSVVP